MLRNNIEDNKKNIFYVPVEKCCNFYGFNYSKKNWHPFTKQVEQIIENPKIDYNNSVIKDFRKKIKQKGFNKVILLNKDIELGKYIPDKVKRKVKESESRIPRPIVPYRIEDNLNDPKYYYYPKNDFFREDNHVSRLKEIYFSMKEEGFKPEKFNGFSSYFIRGVLLKKESDYRFVVVGGRHRIAVLAALGYEQIPVTFHDNQHKGLKWPQVLDINNIENFPIVRNDIYPKELTKEIFNLYFETCGLERAKMLNILRKD